MNRSWMSIFLLGAGLQAGASESGTELSQNTSGLQSYYNDPCVEAPKFCPAYNGPAGLDLCNGWDVYGNASFLYYLPVQDNMPLATTNPNPNPDPLASFRPLSPGSKIVSQTSSWKPGFKVGLGANFNYDDWGAMVEYTWFHNTHKTSASAPNGSTGRLSMAMSQNASNNNTTAVSSTWKLGMDIVDAVIYRDYYVGSKLTLNPFFGMRAIWIDQKETVDFNQISTDTLNAMHMKSDSWGVGTRFGLDFGWLLGSGFRMIGNAAGDICYTQYKTSTSEGPNPTTVPSLLFVTTAYTLKNDQNDLRAHAQAGLGFGWGSYFADRQWHIDFAATYDFQVFWDQNMLRSISGVYTAGDFMGNLYLQGLTFKANLDF